MRRTFVLAAIVLATACGEVPPPPRQAEVTRPSAAQPATELEVVEREGALPLDPRVASEVRTQMRRLMAADRAGDIAEWIRARRQLVSMGASAASFLVVELKSTNISSRFAAAECLVGIGEAAISEVVRFMAANEHAASKTEAAVLLSRIGVARDDEVRALVHGLRDDSYEVRLACAVALLVLNSEPTNAIRTLREGLRNSDSRVARAAFRAVGRAGPGAATLMPDVLELLDRMGRMQSHRDEHLSRVGHQAVPYLLAGMHAGNPEVIALCTECLREVGVPPVEALPVLVGNLAHPDRTVRRETAGALGDMGATAAPAVPALLRFVGAEDREQPDRWGTEPLLKIGSVVPPDVALVVRSLGSDDERVVAAATCLLPLAGADARACALAVLRTAKAGKSVARCAALRALARIDAPPVDALAVLKAGLLDTDIKVRTAAALTLGDRAPLGRSALEHLDLLTKSPDPVDQVLGWGAKAQIQTDDPTPVTQLTLLAAAPPLPAGNLPRERVPGVTYAGPAGREAELSDMSLRAAVRRAALAELARLGKRARAAVAVVTRLATSPDGEFEFANCRVPSYRVLYGIEGATDRVVRGLVEFLDVVGCPYDEVFDLLAEMGPAAKAALPRLEEILEEGRIEDVLIDRQLKLRSEPAIRRIRGW